ncbi:hypothetical protein [Actinomadura montaniterrae]|uniref:hypothetical protein n=1 Tax=Actinomadura montaniterrae TaxID=1803903 RepID=UPI00384D3E74
MHGLRSPAQDAAGLSAVLSDPAVGDFAVATMANGPAHEIIGALEDHFADARPTDVLLVHFSCHGWKDESGRLLFATTARGWTGRTRRTRTRPSTWTCKAIWSSPAALAARARRAGHRTCCRRPRARSRTCGAVPSKRCGGSHGRATHPAARPAGCRSTALCLAARPAAGRPLRASRSAGRWCLLPCRRILTRRGRDVQTARFEDHDVPAPHPVERPAPRQHAVAATQRGQHARRVDRDDHPVFARPPERHQRARRREARAAQKPSPRNRHSAQGRPMAAAIWELLTSAAGRWCVQSWRCRRREPPAPAWPAERWR